MTLHEDRIALAVLAGTEPLSLAFVEDLLGRGLSGAVRLVREDAQRIAERVLAGDPAAGAEFGGDVDLCAGFLRNAANGAKVHVQVEPYPNAVLEAIAEDARRRMRDAEPSGVPAAAAAPAPEPPPAPKGPPTVAELAQRLGMQGKFGSVGELVDAAKVRPILVDGVRECALWRLRKVTGSDAAARELNRDLLKALDAEQAEQERERTERLERRRELRDAVRDALAEGAGR